MASISNRLFLRNIFRQKPVIYRSFCEKGKIEGIQEANINDVHYTENEYGSVVEAEEKKTSLLIKDFRPRIDPSETSVILFPGQGTQFVGMGSKLLEYPNVEQMFTHAKHVLGYDLLDICLNGPVETLNQTKYSQTAIFVCSLAAVEKLRTSESEFVKNCIATAGFSVGEFAALVFGGVLSFEDALRLVKIRAEGMQYVSDMIPSGMMTIIFGADAKISLACRAAQEWCIRQGVDAEHAVCTVCNYLFPHCKVIGGHEEALKFLELNAKEFGIRRCTRLKVSGAFHTKLMEPAQEVFRKALSSVKISRSLIPIYSNVDGHPYRNEKQVIKKLGKQMCSPVRWEQILHAIYQRKQDTAFPKTFECGPGKSLLSILKNVNLKAQHEAKTVSV
ncbi:malonyl-CoA-acyl carrier protein transacylase-like protein [Leptotrombidium deliense]|uniref:[acyl-carrier-protein] S-malonyltransferase n=1 Tax=Leptotrombidium deliense TaxID=299467 RepID=A0A443SNA8_9ACAR|nr:malonyl-CoA-acyl carrier protein transacylase-like protein [Leptotrombidium deliense]